MKIGRTFGVKPRRYRLRAPVIAVAVLVAQLAPAAALARPASAPGVPATVPSAACPMPPAVAGGPSNPHTRFIETTLLPALTGSATRPATLAERMRARKVPGVSVAVIRDGRVAWARGWGVRDAGTCAPVTPDTAFQAASISKMVTALLVLEQVERRPLEFIRK